MKEEGEIVMAKKSLKRHQKTLIVLLSAAVALAAGYLIYRFAALPELPSGTPTRITVELHSDGDDMTAVFTDSEETAEIIEQLDGLRCYRKLRSENIYGGVRAEVSFVYPDGMRTVTLHGGQLWFDGRKTTYALSGETFGNLIEYFTEICRHTPE